MQVKYKLKKGNEIIAENGNTNEAPIAVKVIEPDNIEKLMFLNQSFSIRSQ